MESELNIFWGGIGIGIELNIIGPESKLNRNRLLPELHIIDPGVILDPVSKFQRLCIITQTEKQTIPNLLPPYFAKASKWSIKIL